VKELAELFLVFCRVGMATFGGGYAILPVIERELIVKRRWLNMEEALDYFTIGQITPGVIAVNTATFIGYKRKGPAGGVVATLGFIFPSMIFVSAVALCLSNFAGIPAVEHAFHGIRVAVGVLIFDTVLKMRKGVLTHIKAAVVFIAGFLLSFALSVSPVFIVIAAALAGFLFFRGKPEGEKKP
jgi:chromate transporter